ncbi:hypothetical protein [Pedobacter sp.]
MKKKYISALICFLLLYCHGQLYAQSLDKLNITNVVPPSPEVSALGKYLEFPMNYSSGVPVISIPLYTANSGTLSLPLSISYNSSGIKVEEVASWVGIGWSLSTGPSLYRVVHGLPDDYSTLNGYLYTSIKANIIFGYPETSPEKINAYYKINQNELDVEPDFYYFSAMGYSGKFYYDQQQQAFVQLPKSQVKLAFNTDTDGKIVQWIVTLPNGVKCFFGQTENRQRSAHDIFNSSTVLNFTPNANISSGEATPEHITMWQPTEIKHPDGSLLEFFYNSVISSDFGRGGEMQDYVGDSGCEYATNQLNYSTYVNVSSKSIIQKISTVNADIEFVTLPTLREDVIGGSPALDKIRIKNKMGQLYKTYKFNTAYWTSPTEPNLITIPQVLGGNPHTVSYKRLYLASLEERDASENNPKTHTFTYNSLDLPSRLSASQDYWGFYNNAPNGYLLSPKIKASIVNGGSSGYLPGADRRVDSLYAQARTLTRIKYPTGGATDFSYESNKVSESSIATGDLDYFQFSGLNQQYIALLKTPSNLVPGSFNTYSRTFTVGPNPTYVNFEYTGCSGNVSSFDCPLMTVVEGISNPSFSLMLNQANLSYNLPEGTYKITTTINFSFENPDPDFSVILTWDEQIPNLNNQVIVGALRVKKIIDTDSFGGQILRSFSYSQFSNINHSSGYILNLPMHVFKIACGSSGIISTVSLPNVTRRVSQSAAPLNGGDGQMVRYTNIVEYLDDSKHYKTEYTYSHDLYDFISYTVSSYPFAPIIYRDWRSGLMQKKQVYEYITSGYRPISSKQVFYKDYDGQSISLIGLKHGSTPYPGSFNLKEYGTYTEWYLKSKEIDTLYSYDSGGVKKVIQSKDYGYDKNAFYLLTDTWTYGSDGQTSHQRISYPSHYDVSTGFNTATLLAKNIVDLPIRKESHVNNKIVDGEIIKYNDMGQPISLYSYEGINIDTVAINSLVVLPNYYKFNADIGYDGTIKSNMAEVRKRGGVTVCFLWSYKGQHPIVEIKNADYTTVVSILGHSLIDELANKNPTDIEIKNTVDLLKASNLLRYSQVTSYTYKPLVGMTSMTDAKGMTTYYGYDSFGRLDTVSDHYGHIIKKFDYHYKP